MTQAVWTTFVIYNGVVESVYGSGTREDARSIGARHKARAAAELNKAVTVVIERSNRIKAKRLMESHHRYLAVKDEMRRMAEARTRKGRRAARVQKPVTLTLAFM